MRTSLNEIKTIEAYLNNTLSISDRLVFEARLLLSKKLRQDVVLQQKAIALVQYHFRLALKEKFQHVHNRLFTHPDNLVLREEVLKLFKS